MDLDALYIINPGDYSICEEVEKLDKERRIKMITNDVINKQKPFMDRGVIAATIGQQPRKSRVHCRCRFYMIISGWG